MVVNTISEAKAQLSMLLEKAQHGEEIIIAKAGRPVTTNTRTNGSLAPCEAG